MIILSAKNLSKVYGTDVILEKVSFHINAGDRIGIVGKNGAGKSTLLNMLTGEMSCDECPFHKRMTTCDEQGSEVRRTFGEWVEWLMEEI